MVTGAMKMTSSRVCAKGGLSTFGAGAGGVGSGCIGPGGMADSDPGVRCGRGGGRRRARGGRAGSYYAAEPTMPAVFARFSGVRASEKPSDMVWSRSVVVCKRSSNIPRDSSSSLREASLLRKSRSRRAWI